MEAKRETATKPATATSIARDRKNPMGRILQHTGLGRVSRDVGEIVDEARQTGVHWSAHPSCGSNRDSVGRVAPWLPGMGSNHR